MILGRVRPPRRRKSTFGSGLRRPVWEGGESTHLHRTRFGAHSLRLKRCFPRPRRGRISRLFSETIMTFGPRWNFVLTRSWRRLKVYSRRRCPSSLKSWRCGPCSLRLSLWRGLPSPRMPAPPRAMKWPRKRRRPPSWSQPRTRRLAPRQPLTRCCGQQPGAGSGRGARRRRDCRH